MNNSQIIEYTRKILSEGSSYINNKEKADEPSDKNSSEQPQEPLHVISQPHIINNITVSSSNRFETLLILFFFLVYPFLEYYRPSKEFTEEQIKYALNQIQHKEPFLRETGELNDINQLVKLVANKEGVSENFLQNELRKKYKYKETGAITLSLYHDIKKYLEARLEKK